MNIFKPTLSFIDIDSLTPNDYPLGTRLPERLSDLAGRSLEEARLCP